MHAAVLNMNEEEENPDFSAHILKLTSPFLLFSCILWLYCNEQYFIM